MFTNYLLYLIYFPVVPKYSNYLNQSNALVDNKIQGGKFE